MGEEVLLPVEHGGSLARAEAMFPNAPRPFVDLSTGINPHSYPVFVLPASALKALPEPARVRQLEGLAARHYGAPGDANVVAAPGTQILLPLLYSQVPPGTAAVLGPTYEEHARAAAMAGHTVRVVGSVDELLAADVAVIVNPNNPDGRIVPRAEMLRQVAAKRDSGGLLVVDEAFMDVGPRGASVCGEVDEGNIVVLRSFGKFFGLAGVRLGFAVAAPSMAEGLRSFLGPWAISGPALEYGLRALADIPWQQAARIWLASDADRLDALLAEAGLDVNGGTYLFRHLKLPQASSMHQALGLNGVLVRAFAGRPDELRIGLPGTAVEWERLRAALFDWTSQPERKRAS